MIAREYTRLAGNVFARVGSNGEVWITTLVGPSNLTGDDLGEGDDFDASSSRFRAYMDYMDAGDAICITPAVLDALKRYVAELGKESK